jgi:PAS domain S-box-containing protein
MEELRDRVTRGDLVLDVRRLLEKGADDHLAWIRTNIRNALAQRGRDAVAVAALTGLAPGTVRGFLNGRPSSIRNVLLIAEAIGHTLAELDQPPVLFAQRDPSDTGRRAAEGAIGPSLLAFDESAAAMAILLPDGRIVKVNRRLRQLLGYEEGDLVGSPAATYLVDAESDRAERQADLAAGDVMPQRVRRLRRKDGSLVTAVTSAVVVRDDDGQPRYVIARAAPTRAPAEGVGGELSEQA